MRRLLAAALFLLVCATARAAGVPANCRQLLVASAPDWDTNQGTMQRYERSSASAPWKPVGPAVPVLFGKKGMA